ncbi:MAG: CvpA family protein [Kiritimatiellae bacterium]|nr:CvpA family protein [Kiritimatiellia bacterium]
MFGAVDYVIAAVVGGCVIIGLFKGLSGCLGTLAGAVAAAVATTLAFGTLFTFAGTFTFLAGNGFQRPAAFVLNFILGLIVFGLTRRFVVKFVSFLVPQPLNAIIGGIGGLCLGLALVGLLAGSAVLEGVRFEDGFVAAHSQIVRLVATQLDARLGGGNEP